MLHIALSQDGAIVKKKNSFACLNVVNLFWLFIVGSLLGVVIEGVFCVFHYGRWETHVVSMWLPLCILYGIGAVGCYVGHCFLQNQNTLYQFVAYFVIFSVIELIGGLLLEFGLGMRAWTYVNAPMNVRGHICLEMSMYWGFFGLAFEHFLACPLDKVFLIMQSNKIFRIVTYCLIALLLIDFFITWAGIIRWSQRHYGIAAHTGFGRWLDTVFPDAFMQHRFCEWRFLR